MPLFFPKQNLQSFLLSISLPGPWAPKSKLKIITTVLVNPLPFPRPHQPCCVASKSKLIWNHFRHRDISSMVRACCNGRRASSTLPRCPHTRPTTRHDLVLEAKRIWRDEAECWRCWSALWDSNPSKPFWIRKDLTARAWWGRRRKQGVVSATPAYTGRRVIPVGFESRGSGSWGAQWGCDRSTNWATVNVEMGKLGGGGWWRSRWEVLEPWDEGTAIYISIGSIRRGSWAWKGRGAWAWVVGSTWAWLVRCTGAWLVRWTWTCWCRSTHNIHAFHRLASLHEREVD